VAEKSGYSGNHCSFIRAIYIKHFHHSGIGSMVKNRAKRFRLNTLSGVMKLTFKVSQRLTMNIVIVRVFSLLTESSLKIVCEMPAGRQ